MNSVGERLETIYRLLYEHFGPQHWWPAETPFEMALGAILTQNTNWKNVSKSLEVIRSRGLLRFEALAGLPESELAGLIKSSGYYNLKARRIKNLLQMIVEDHAGELDGLLSANREVAREQLLSVVGIGPETADSILLYGANKAVFVVDAYTHRILHRHGLAPEDCGYQELQDLFMDHLAPDPVLFNEYHALLVRTGKEYCRKKNPRCDVCPLTDV